MFYLAEKMQDQPPKALCKDGNFCFLSAPVRVGLRQKKISSVNALNDFNDLNDLSAPNDLNALNDPND
jgi:hypothetical protein